MITVEPEAAAVVLRLDGRLAGLEARELAANWNTLPFKQPDQRVVFDLTRVTFVDRAGLEFLAKAHRSGDSLIGGATTTSIVEQIIAGSDSLTLQTLEQKSIVTAVLNDCTQFSTIDVEGTLRAPLSADLRRNVETLLSRGHRCILLNLARLSDIDAAGIGELMHAYARTSAAGGVLRISHASQRVRRLLDVTEISRLLDAPDLSQVA